MPTWLLILRIRNFAFPLPWFLLWILLAPFAAVASIVGGILRVFGVNWYPAVVMSESWRVLMLVACLHGLEVRVDSSSENILLRFV